MKDSIFKSKRIQKILFIIAIFVIFILQIVIQRKDDFQKQNDGVLTSSQSTSTFPAIKFGGTILQWTGNPTEHQMEFLDGDFIYVKMIDGRVSLTTQIRDSDGHLIGDIIDNHWRIYSPQFIIDRNFNSDTLEVKNLKGDITFQAKLYGNMAWISGYYYEKAGNGKADFFGPWIADSLFQYPSIEHPGELNKNAVYATLGAIMKLSK